MNLEKRMRERIHVQGKSKETFKTYWHWCARYIDFCVERGIGKETRAESAVEDWLTFLAVDRRVSKTTQNLALQSVCYLYRQVLGRPLEGVSAIRAKRPQQVREVASVEEVSDLFCELSGVPLLVAQMMYGCGLRISDVARLRRKDIHFDRSQLHIHTAKGDKGRFTCFPKVLHDPVRRQLDSVRILHRLDIEQNPNGVSLPYAWRRKSPRSGLDFSWYYLFPSDSLSRDDSDVLCRHHRDKGHLAREIKQAAERAGIERRITSHVLRHSYATHANEQGVDMRILQQLLGHSDIRTTETYVHANKDRATAAKSPLETLQDRAQTLRESQLSNPQRKERHGLKVYADYA